LSFFRSTSLFLMASSRSYAAALAVLARETGPIRLRRGLQFQRLAGLFLVVRLALRRFAVDQRLLRQLVVDLTEPLLSKGVGGRQRPPPSCWMPTKEPSGLDGRLSFQKRVHSLSLPHWMVLMMMPFFAGLLAGFSG